MPHSNTGNIKNLRCVIDELKYNETDKGSRMYQVLNAVETIVKDFRFWKRVSPKSEYTYLRKFENLLEVILDDTELVMLDGESVCESTRDSLRSSLENNREMTEFGRRIDLLINCSGLDTTVELCSIEFKKDDASIAQVIQQQSKNARVNSCILGSLNRLTKALDNGILSIDFVVSNGYLSQMFGYDDVIISQKVSFLNIPTDVYDLGSLRHTLKHLYLWKKHVLALAAKVIKSLYTNKRRYSLIEACEEDGGSSPNQYLTHIKVNDVFMTPRR